MNHSPELDKIAPAICAMQAELESVPQTSTNPHFKSRYAKLPACLDHIRPLMSKHGLSLVQVGEPAASDEIGLTTMVLHKSGQFISGTITMTVGRGGGPQAAGSAITYARRYMLSAAIGLASDDDDDGNAAQDNYKNQPRTQSSGGDPLEGIL